jgi:hypothetical protein
MLPSLPRLWAMRPIRTATGRCGRRRTHAICTCLGSDPKVRHAGGMGIEIAKGTARRLIRERTGALIQVRSADLAAAERALDAAASHIAQLKAGHHEVPYLAPGELASPKMVSDVIPTPSGPMLAFDLGEDLPDARVGEIPGLIVAELRRVGVAKATVLCPRRGGPLDRLIRSTTLAPPPYPTGPGLLLWAPAGRPVPDSWVDSAMTWLSAGEAGAKVAVDVSSVQFTVKGLIARRLLRQIINARSTSCLMAAGDLDRRVRAVHVTTIFTSRLTLAERGPDVTVQDRADTAEQLAGIGRRLAADVEYAAVDLDVGDDFSSWFQCGINSGWFEHWGAELVEGAFWWQLLGDGHLARMADPAACTALPVAGRHELVCGQPAQWLPGQPSRAQLQHTCHQILDHCLDEAIPDPDGGMMLPPVP